MTNNEEKIDYKFNNENLVEITTQRQKKNGTRQFFDHKHRVHYISYSSGYVRREIRTHDKRSQSLINPVTRHETYDDNPYFKTIRFKSEVRKINCEISRLGYIDDVSIFYSGYSIINKKYLI